MNREEFIKKWVLFEDGQMVKDLDELLSLPPAEGATDKFRDVLHEVQRLIETEGGATESEMKAIWNSLSCAITESERRSQPPAEGAEAILHRHIDKQSMDELSVNVWPDMLEAMHEFAAQPQPTADGAEEILEKYGFKIICHKEAADAINDAFVQPIVAAMHEFATLHAQRIADKMVSERLREELTDWADYWNKLETGHACIMKEDIDEYLKTRESHD